MKRLLMICGMAALLLVNAASARGGGSITLDTAAPTWGSSITFTFTPAATYPSTYVLVSCGSMQGRNGEAAGSVQYQSAAYPATGATQASFVLPIVTETGYCTGKLMDRGNGSTAHLLASTSFTISP